MGPALCDSALTPIGNCPQKFTRKRLCALFAALAVALGGCGGDDEDPPPTSADTTPAGTETEERAPDVTETETETEPGEPAPETDTATAPAESPEDEEGGVGDEEPARTLALFTGRNGRITPRVIRVPAFISIQVELRSADGSPYTLRFNRESLTAGGELSSVSTTIDGLRPNQAIVGRPAGAGNPVRVEATAEPGP
jgi:hypothetical protein